LKRWLTALVREKKLVRVGRSSATRYRLPAVAVSSKGPAADRSVTQAVHTLVTMPLLERLPAEYRRAMLDNYRPNETYCLCENAVAGVLEKVAVKGWREKGGLDRVAAELAASTVALEDALDPSTLSTPGVRRTASPTAAELMGWVTQRPSAAERPDIQLTWNIRTVLDDLVNRKPSPPVSAALLADMYAKVSARVLGRTASGRSGRVEDVAPVPTAPSTRPPIRTLSLALPGTVYDPLSNRRHIQPCFDQTLQLASAITDPLEQSFFLVTHLLYLLPFPALNATMSLLAMNVPLVSNGLSPLTLSNVPTPDLLTALRGVWEFGRPELLAEVFAQRENLK
jgi:hypothetical protein